MGTHIYTAINSLFRNLAALRICYFRIHAVSRKFTECVACIGQRHTFAAGCGYASRNQRAVSVAVARRGTPDRALHIALARTEPNLADDYVSENDNVVAKLLKKFDDVKICEPEISLNYRNFTKSDLPDYEKTEYGAHVLPDKANGAGPLYFCLLQKLPQGIRIKSTLQLNS